MFATAETTFSVGNLLKPDEKLIPLAMRVAVSVALLSNWFEFVHGWAYTDFVKHNLTVFSVLMAFCVVAALFKGLTRIAVLIYSILILPDLYTVWPVMANHYFLFIWCIPMLAFVEQWWERPEYPAYLRLTLGFVMLAAAAQKLLAGTYLDGSYIAYLSHYGAVSEQSFHFLCSTDTLYDPCFMHRAIGSFIVAWQIFVGVVLLAGFRSVIFIAVEIAFLIGAGLYADEMNFQVLNIALLCIAFRIGMSFPLAAVCVVLLFVDVYSISEIIKNALALLQ